MKNYSLVYAVVAAVVLSACGGTSQSPLSKYPRVAEMTPTEKTVQAQDANVKWKVETKVEPIEVPKYIVREVGQFEFFSVMAPSQFQFVVEKTISIPVRVRGLVGQMKYEVSVESSKLGNLKLENIKVEGNETSAEVVLTANKTDIPDGKVVSLGNLSIKMNLIEVKDQSPEMQKFLLEKAKTNGAHSVSFGYVILPAGSEVTALKGENQ